MTTHWDVYRAIARQQYETIKHDECQPCESISDVNAQHETEDARPVAASDEGADSEMEAQS